MNRKLTKLVRGIQAFLLFRSALRYGAYGALLVAAFTITVTLLAPEIPRLPWLALLSIGPFAGLLYGFIKRPSPSDITLYIDRKLGAESSIITTFELDEEERLQLAGTRKMAEDKLSAAHLNQVRPKMTSQMLWLYPVAAVCFSGAFLLPSSSPSAGVPGTEEVRLDAEELLAFEHLAEETLEDQAQEERLERLAKEATELRQLLSEGMEQREALNKVAELSGAVEREIGRETREQRRARDRAIEALESETDMARALSERDRDAFDRAVERAASRREGADRTKAGQALADASDAAAGEGDGALSQLLAQSERRLKRRSEQAQLARELLTKMPELEDSLTRALEHLEREGEGEALNEALVQAMSDAWSRLTQEERQRLAEALREAPVAPNTGQCQNDADRQLSADEIEAKLRKALVNLDDLSLRLGSGARALPLPMGGGSRSSGSSGQGGQPLGTGGHIDSQGETEQLGDTEGLIVRVRPALGEGSPTFSTVSWVNPRGTEEPNEDGRAPAPLEAPVTGSPGAIERAPIPEDYEDHLRRYFGDAPQ